MTIKTVHSKRLGLIALTILLATGLFPLSSVGVLAEELTPQASMVTLHYRIADDSIGMGYFIGYASSDELMGSVSRNYEFTRNPYDVPFGCTAVPKVGYLFSHWEDDGYAVVSYDISYRPSQFDRHIVYTAYFKINPAEQLRVARLYGQDRYQTSGAIHNYHNSQNPTAGTVILVAGEDNAWPDAMSASGLSGAEGGAPIVLTPTNSLSTKAKAAIETPGVRKVLVIGGKITDAVLEKIRALNTNIEVRRIAGANRQSTAVGIYDAYSLATWSSTAILVTGYNFADAASIGSFAAKNRCPIFYTELGNNSFSDETLLRLKKTGIFKRLIVVGSTRSVSNAAVAQVQKATGLTQSAVVRLGGQDRYDTSAKVARWATSLERPLSERMSYGQVGIVRGDIAADLLGASALQGLSGSVLLLTGQANRTSAKTELATNARSVREVRFFGGEASIPISVTKDCLLTLGWSSRQHGITWIPDETVKINLTQS